jgi:hypothetical protein
MPRQALMTFVVFSRLFRPARAAWVTVVRERDVAAKRFSLFVDSESGSP